MTVVDGQPADTVPAGDRGLAYGDGLFETIRILAGKPVLLERHLARLERGCEHLQIPASSLREEIAADFEMLGAASIDDGIIKVIVTRGESGRGYRPSPSSRPCRIVSRSGFEGIPNATGEGIAVKVCQTRLAINPSLAGIKHLNRLEQVLAAAELGDYIEGLMLDTEETLVEGTRTNVFACLAGMWHTPLLDRCGVSGVMREHLIERTGADEKRLSIAGLEAASDVFVCNSVIGVQPVTRIDVGAKPLTFDVGDATRLIMKTLGDEFGSL